MLRGCVENYRPWTKEEDEILRRHYPLMGPEVRKLLPHRTVSSIYHRANRLGLKYMNQERNGVPYRPWTKEEVEYLKRNYAIAPREELVRKLGRAWNTIKCKARKLGLRRANIREKTRQGLRNLKPVSISDIDAAYIAGLIDGEGSITFEKGKHPTVVIYNTSKELIEYIRRTLGVGSILKNKRRGWRTCYYYHTTNFHDTYAVLARVLPYLRLKRDKALKAIKYILKKRKEYLGLDQPTAGYANVEIEVELVEED